jgi:hypothetical protein
VQDLLSIAADVGGLGVDSGTGAESVPVGVAGNVPDDGEDEGGRGGDVRGPVHGEDGGGAGNNYCGEAIGGRPGWRSGIAHLGEAVVGDLRKKSLRVLSGQYVRESMLDSRSANEDSSRLRPTDDDYASASGFLSS